MASRNHSGGPSRSIHGLQPSATPYSVPSQDGISLWLFSDLFIEKGWTRWLNVVLTPLAASAAMSAIGAWRRHRDMGVIRLDSVSYGYCFAQAMAVVRFVWGE